MSWTYGDDIMLGESKLEVGSDDYDKWSELANILFGDDDEHESCDEKDGECEDA